MKWIGLAAFKYSDAAYWPRDYHDYHFRASLFLDKRMIAPGEQLLFLRLSLEFRWAFMKVWPMNRQYTSQCVLEARFVRRGFFSLENEAATWELWARIQVIRFLELKHLRWKWIHNWWLSHLYETVCKEVTTKFRSLTSFKTELAYPSIRCHICWVTVTFQAGSMMNIRVKKIPLDPKTFKVDLRAMKRAITRRTCMVSPPHLSST